MSPSVPASCCRLDNCISCLLSTEKVIIRVDNNASCVAGWVDSAPYIPLQPRAFKSYKFLWLWVMRTAAIYSMPFVTITLFMQVLYEYGWRSMRAYTLYSMSIICSIVRMCLLCEEGGEYLIAPALQPSQSARLIIWYCFNISHYHTERERGY